MLIVPFYALLWFARYRYVLSVLLAGAGAALASSLYANVSHGELHGQFVSQDLSPATFVSFFLLATLAGAQVARDDMSAHIGQVWLAQACVAAYLALKLGPNVGGFDGRLSLMLLALLFASVVLLALSLGDPAIVARLRAIPMVGALAALIDSLTLEIYLIHSVILAWPPLSEIIIPLKVMALCATMVVLALAAHCALSVLLARLNAIALRPKAATKS